MSAETYEFGTAATFLPTHAEYEPLVKACWSGTSVAVRPAAIVTPTSTEEMAAVMRQLVKKGLTFTVRSGGHQPNPMDGTVLISMSRMDSVEYDESTTLARVGTGVRMYSGYKALEKYGVAIAGGTNGAPGMGGYMVGGGISFFYNTVGFSSDMAVEYTVVLASGEIVQARADNEHSELFWALRAGGPNFGIVTHFKVRTFPCSRLWAGMRAWGGPEGYPQAIAALKHWFAEGSNDPLASVTFAVTGKDSAMAVLCYNDGGKMENTPPSVFKKLLDVPARAGALTRTTLSDVTRGSFGIGEDGLRRYFNTFTIKNDGDLFVELAEQYHQAAEELRADVPSFVPNIAALVLPENFIRKQAEGAGPCMLDPALGSSICILHLSTWGSADDDKTCMDFSVRMTNTLKAVAKERGKLHPWVFMNDAGTEQDVFAGYLPANVERLKTVARKYDPEGVFQRKLRGGFKLGGEAGVV